MVIAKFEAAIVAAAITTAALSVSQIAVPV